MQGFTAGPIIVLDEMLELSTQIDVTLQDTLAYPVKIIRGEGLQSDPFLKDFINSPQGQSTKAVVITIFHTEKYEC